MAIDQVDPPMVSQPTNLVAVSVLMADSRRPSTTMKAIVQDSYGPPASVLKLREVAKPSVSDGEVLVRVHAASIHTGDFILARGLPYFLRFVTGVRKPKLRVPGTDVAGTVEAVGKDVSLLEVGDEVFG
jgi:NADPH:quinone reductase-like Zn-dependent oxidoreductase